MAWAQTGNLKGAKGDPGTNGTNGTNGANGARGSLIYTGTGAPGTIAGAQAGDQYLDTATGNWYTFS